VAAGLGACSTHIWGYLLAYNLIRLTMAQAVQLAEFLPRQLSVKHTVQLWIALDYHRPGTGNNDDQNPTRCSPNHVSKLARTFANMVTPKN